MKHMKVYAVAIKDPRYGSRDFRTHMFWTERERTQYLQHRLEDNPTIEYSLAEWERDWPETGEEINAKQEVE